MLNQEGTPGSHKTTRQVGRETGISQRSVGRITHKDIQLYIKSVTKRRAQELTVSICDTCLARSSILISVEIVLMRVSKPKANSLNICCDVFVHNCHFFTTFNACITVFMNRLTHCVSQGSVMTFTRRDDNYVTVLLQIHSGICLSKLSKQNVI